MFKTQNIICDGVWRIFFFFSKSGSVLSFVPSKSWQPGSRAIYLSMPGMSAQVPRESIEKHSGLNPLTVTNVSVLFQVELERMSEGAISVSETTDGWRMTSWQGKRRIQTMTA